jgi:hypothetical protein
LDEISETKKAYEKEWKRSKARKYGIPIVKTKLSEENTTIKPWDSHFSI